MKLSALFFTFTLLTSSLSHACIWKNSDSPYWKSKNIPVCFIKPDGPFTFDMKKARYTIKKAYKTQFNKRTPFNFTGFKFCKKQSNPSKIKPGVRIALTYGMGGGISSGVGPKTAKDSPNLSIDYIGIDRSTQQPTFSATTTTNVTLHETLHLFGFLHDTDRHNKRRLASIQHHNPVFVGEFDPDSVVVNPNATVLSDGDIRCLKLIANREMASTSKTKKDSELDEISLDLGDVQADGKTNLQAELEVNKDLSIVPENQKD